VTTWVDGRLVADDEPVVVRLHDRRVLVDQRTVHPEAHCRSPIARLRHDADRLMRPPAAC
jgi:hypothetical protein